MADPTSEIRKAVTEKILPKGSPLRKSIEADYKAKEEQLIADEANNFVMQRDPVNLPADANAFVNPVIPQTPAAPTEFVNPGQPQADSVRSIASAPPTLPVSPGVTDRTPEINQGFDAYQTQSAAIDSDIQKVQQERQAALDRLAEDDANLPKVEPKGFFTGKNTWQKVLGGVGLFLSSFTPEGARNVANIIDKEIERDMDAQKTNIKLQQDKNNKDYQRMIEKYGSQEAALLAKKRDAFGLLDLHMKKLEMASRNEETRARISQGREEINLKREALTNELLKAHLSANKEAQKGMIPGFQGSNQNPAIVKDITERVTAQKAANKSLEQLEELLSKGARVGENAALANQIRDKAAADLAKAMFGRSSDSELEQARNLIPDVTSMMQRGSVDKTLLKNLKQKLAQEVKIAAETAGFTQNVPSARKVQ